MVTTVALWFTGAGLLALLVLKLFVIDLGNVGGVARIVSFLFTGVLLLVVGYYSPMPPASPPAGAREDERLPT